MTQDNSEKRETGGFEMTQDNSEKRETGGFEMTQDNSEKRETVYEYSPDCAHCKYRKPHNCEQHYQSINRNYRLSDGRHDEPSDMYYW